MRYKKRNCQNRCIASKTDTSAHETSKLLNQIHILELQFTIEKDAKNIAYAFILSRGLLKEFSDYQQKTKNENHHILSIKILSKYGK